MNTINKSLNRRQLLRLVGIGAGGALLAACAPAAAPSATTAPAAPAATTAATTAPAAAEATAAPAAAEATKAPAMAANVNSVGKELPADAAPSEQQVLVGAQGEAKPGQYMDITGSVYNRGPLSDQNAVPLTRINKDFEMTPGSAKSWSVDDKGTVWTFILRDDIIWSDDTRLTADDFVATFQSMADPKSAYDFTWYYSKGSGNVKNFDEVVAGKMPVTDLGVRKGASDLELIIETSESTPYLPRLGVYISPLQKKALEAHGPTYNNDPKTAVSCGPFIVTLFTPTRVELTANAKAAPDIKPYINKWISVQYPNSFQAYQAGQVDNSGLGNAADIDVALNDPVLSKDIAPDVGDFRTDYFFFNVTKAPFDNLKFRQALSHLLDRDSIVKFITKPVLARPAYSYLAPGFPAANGEALKDIQAFDPEKAKTLFAESGVKIDKLLLQVRGDIFDGFFGSQIGQAYADAIKTNLGIEVEVKSVPQKDFTDALLKKDAAGKPATTIDFGYISYGMDFLDPSNMFGVLKGSDLGGRHTWNDKGFQDLLLKAGPMINVEERTKTYQEAEKIAVESCAFIFSVHRTPLNLWKPYIRGTQMAPGKINTNPGFAWPGVSSFNGGSSDIYIGNNVLDFRKNLP